MKKSKLGFQGERFAENFLKRSGFQILERNFRINGGEIDLICQKGGVIVFVEVKARKSLVSGHPLESITPFKRERLLRTGLFYLNEKKIPDKPFRFDLVAIVFDDGGEVKEVQHVENFLEG